MQNSNELAEMQLNEQQMEEISGGITFGDICPNCKMEIKAVKHDFKGHVLCKNCGAVLKPEDVLMRKYGGVSVGQASGCEQQKTYNL